MKHLLLILACFAFAAPVFSADDTTPQDKKKAAALADFDSKIKANTNRVTSLTKQLGKLKPQIAAVQKAADKLSAAKTAMDAAQQKMEDTRQFLPGGNGQGFYHYDQKAVKAYEDAQKANNQAKRDYRGADEQLAALKEQEAALKKQLDATNDKLAELQDSRAKLVEAVPEPISNPDQTVDALGNTPADAK